MCNVYLTLMLRLHEIMGGDYGGDRGDFPPNFWGGGYSILYPPTF
jgi:hypothetical protein